ncbi:MAG: FIST signal transduction protein [Armatimonadota bacterium]
MARYAVAQSDEVESGPAGAALGKQLLDGLAGESPDAVIVFASARYEHPDLLHALQATARPGAMVGASSAGEFTSDVPHEHSACAVGIVAPEMRFAAALGRGITADARAAAEEVTRGFRGLDGQIYPYRTALVLTDALAGHAETLVERITLRTGGSYQLVGGGAGDDARFHRTHVFCGVEAVEDAVVALEILSEKPLGIGLEHGWRPASAGLRVTSAEGTRLISLNAVPAVQAFEDHAAATGQQFDPEQPLSFFLHNVLGIDTGFGHKLRVPLSIGPDGSVNCAAEVPVGATVNIMSATAGPAEAAECAVGSALGQLGNHQPGAALFFDCVATRLRIGRDFGIELGAIQQALGNAPFAGCNTYGQIARADGQFSGFHNCTAVVCVLPR